MASTTKHLLLIDSSGFAYRAYHAGSRFPRYRESDGMPTGAVIGFLEILWRLLGDVAADPVSHAAAVFDPPGKTFRHDIYPSYKANRQARDPELTLQLPVMREAARALGLPAVEAPGFEADDVIATLAWAAVKEGIRVTLVSSDKDLGQLVRNDRIEIVDPLVNKRVLADDVETKFGVPPELVADVQALSGDAVDNIPGVPGVGAVLAARLVRKLGSLQAVMKEANKPSGYRMSATVRLALRKHMGDLPLYHQLTRLRDDVPGLPPMVELEARPIIKAHLDELLKALEANRRFRKFFEPSRVSIYEQAEKIEGDAYDWHRKALAEYQRKLKAPSYRITLPAPDTPQCGWYKRRLVKHGPWVPARIWRQPLIDFETDKAGAHEQIFCTVGDTAKNPVDQWGWLLNAPISKDDYDHLMKVRSWAQRYAPSEPEANPEQAIDWNRVTLE